MAKEKEAPTPLPEKKAAPKSKKWLIIGVAVALLAAGGGGAAYWKFGHAAAAPAEEAGGHAGKAEAAKKGEAKAGGDVPEDPGMVPFEPFLVNLADAQTYLRVTLSLLVESEEAAKTLEAKPVTLTRIRSALLEVLATQSAERLATPEGKTELKQAIREHLATLDLEIEIHDVLFSDFVVQY